MVLHDLSNDTLILTRRSMRLRSHPGEVCFPGGRWQVGDKNLYATALRELQEELTISPSRVKLMRALSPESTLIGDVIYPWFASIENLLPYMPNSDEVSEVISIPLMEVVKLSNYKAIIINRAGLHFKSEQFIMSTHFVWGATVRIMKQLITEG